MQAPPLAFQILRHVNAVAAEQNGAGIYHGLEDFARTQSVISLTWPESEYPTNPSDCSVVAGWHNVSCRGRWELEAIMRDYSASVQFSGARIRSEGRNRSRMPRAGSPKCHTKSH